MKEFHTGHSISLQRDEEIGGGKQIKNQTRIECLL